MRYDAKFQGDPLTSSSAASNKQSIIEWFQTNNVSGNNLSKLGRFEFGDAIARDSGNAQIERIACDTKWKVYLLKVYFDKEETSTDKWKLFDAFCDSYLQT